MNARFLTTAVLALGLFFPLKHASAQNKLTPLQKRLLSGFASQELERYQTGVGKQSSVSVNASVQFLPLTSTDLVAYFPQAGNGQCKEVLGTTNVKVNQNCLDATDFDLQGRGQANNNPSIAADPNNSNHLVVGSDDYRGGDRACVAAYSLDNGVTWNDSIIPIGFTRGNSFGSVPREYWQVSGAPSVSWDSRHNAYLACLTFQRGSPVTNNPDQSSAVYVFRSTENNGASWNFAGRPAVIQPLLSSGIGVPLIDKPYMAIDNHVGSPFQDRIYATWTLFGVDGSAYIFESHSNNYGQSFSSPVLVSTSSTVLCPNTFGIVNPNGPCNTNQFSQPFIGPDGALYVVYSNFNNAVASTPLCGSSPCDNHFQILLTKSTNGGVSFSAPVRVGIYYDLPDCATYQGGQGGGQSCVPEKGTSVKSVFGAVNYPVGAVNPLNHNEVVVTFGSYINPHSKEANGCVPAGLSLFLNALYSGVKTAGACNNDILVSVSTNGGASFTGTNTNPRSLTSLNQAPGQGSTDQWWQWAAFNVSGKFLVSYYDRVYGSDETNASSDISLSSSTGTTLFQTVRVTSSSMPPPTQFTNSSGNGQIYGGYSGFAVGGSTAHPIWADTRNSDVFICPGSGAPGVPPTLCTALEVSGVKGNDQDIFTRAITE